MNNNIDANALNAENKTKRFEVKLNNKKNITITKYSALDEQTQEVALKVIGEINKKVSTDGKKTWEECGYTSQICNRLATCLNAKNTLFLAFDEERPIGYVAFYTRQDDLLYTNRFLKSENEAYCSWTGVDEEYRGQGLAEYLKLQIFEPEHEIQRFRGHIKVTNAASIRVLDKFTEKGYETKKKLLGTQYLYSVHKK
jgi:GNAT superfamily N-acetyltransferase